MLACEPLIGWRIIAAPTALDATSWPAGSIVVRISPDDVYLVGAAAPTVPDEHAIVTPEHGFVGIALSATQVAEIADRHIEWEVPAGPTLAQGQIAGVPAKLVIAADGRAQLLVATAAHHELLTRLAGVRA